MKVGFQSVRSKKTLLISSTKKVLEREIQHEQTSDQIGAKIAWCESKFWRQNRGVEIRSRDLRGDGRRVIPTYCFSNINMQGMDERTLRLDGDNYDFQEVEEWSV